MNPKELDARRIAAISGSPDVRVFDTLPSTNTCLRDLAVRGGIAPRGAILAVTQTAGRGRLGRNFFSPAGSGLYMSVLLPADIGGDVPVTCLVADAAAGVLERLTGLPIGIKWVNDLYCRGRKLCGILCESFPLPDAPARRFCIVGIGINCFSCAFPPELSGIATSIEEEGGAIGDLSQFAGELLGAVLSADFSGRAVPSGYRARSLVLGKEVTVLPHVGEPYRAKVLSILDDGALLVAADSGEKRIDSGDVSLRLS